MSKRGAFSLALGLLTLTLAERAHAQFNWVLNNGAVTITGYVGNGGAVTIPTIIENMPVTNLGDDAFSYITTITSITIPTGVTNIGNGTFYSCTKLGSITVAPTLGSIGNFAFGACPVLLSLYFEGDAPNLGLQVFDNNSNAAVYYLPGTAGWDSTLGGRPTVLWNPQVQAGDGYFGVQNNHFGFNVTGTLFLTVVVESSDNLANPIWSPLATNILLTSSTTTNAPGIGSFYFSDPHWMDYPSRFYQLRWP